MKPLDLLGPLEGEVMEVMWREREATVRQVVEIFRNRRMIAYTTVMTVMNNLVTKRVLERVSHGKAYLYRAALTPEEFLKRSSKEAVGDVLARFGDLAIARFLEATAQLKPDDLARLKRLAEQGEREDIKKGDRKP